MNGTIEIYIQQFFGIEKQKIKQWAFRLQRIPKMPLHHLIQIWNLRCSRSLCCRCLWFEIESESPFPLSLSTPTSLLRSKPSQEATQNHEQCQHCPLWLDVATFGSSSSRWASSSSPAMIEWKYCLENNYIKKEVNTEKKW